VISNVIETEPTPPGIENDALASMTKKGETAMAAKTLSVTEIGGTRATVETTTRAMSLDEEVIVV
jgi:hypothetical protein